MSIHERKLSYLEQCGEHKRTVWSVRVRGEYFVVNDERNGVLVS